MTNPSTYTTLGEVRSTAAIMHEFYKTGATLSLEHRCQALLEMRAYLKSHEEELLDALRLDLGKSPFEGYATELGIVYDEIRLCLKKMKKWTEPKRVPTSLMHFPSRSKVYPSPLGVVLVLSPWNYPIQLALVPLVDAIAAGNCVALKPSRTSRATGDFLIKMINELFPPEFVCAFPGSGKMNDWLLQVRWDQIFFTGSPAVGHTIMEAAAKFLTPVVLELGGKSPCIVHKDANIKRAAQRIAWGKGINTGQTCVAPDYFLVHESVADELIEKLATFFHHYYGRDILSNEEWPHIINERHFDRLNGLIESRNPQAKITFGGKSDKASLKIEPTCLTGITLEDPIMQEEIFGPLLPIITYQSLDEAFAIVRTFEKPLATYIFSEDKAVQQRVIRELSFGGATINDTVIHLANNNMGFGGVGNSGMGAYHGKVGFDCFTHYKSTLKKGTWLELPVRTPPFEDKVCGFRKFSLLRKFMR